MILEKEVNNIALENKVPQSSDLLKELRVCVADFVKKKGLIPPLQQNEIIELSNEIITQHIQYEGYTKIIAVMINNYVWQPIVASIPYDRRILLLPKCLRNTNTCTAKFDELGLLCQQCGACVLDNYISKAEQLGYHVIVSEGTGTVSLLLSSGQIECVIGVACLDSFERSFPLTLQEAIPSIAIPLFNSDCKDSSVDDYWIEEVLPLQSNNKWNSPINIESLKKTVKDWFTPHSLKTLFPNTDESEMIAKKWLDAGGKRLRPIIMAAVYKALTGKDIVDNEQLKKLAIAIECFHKASLAHDDIADEDAERYGKPSLHEQYNLPIALNTGDLLISYGYLLIAGSGANAKQISRLLTVASQGHKDLCLGQGKELLSGQNPEMFSVNKIIDIFTKKTAPAFEVALKFGAIAAGADNQILDILNKYSKAIGVAYQIKDDLDDFNQDSKTSDIRAMRSSLILAILAEKSPKKMQAYLNDIRNGSIDTTNKIFQWAHETGAIDLAKDMLQKYQAKALKSLDELKDASLKVLLYKLLNKIIGKVN